jgi:hypothetical protein
MSVSQNRELSSWKDVQAQLGRIETTWRQKSLSPTDQATWREAILLTMLLLSDLSKQYYGMGTHRDHVLWGINTAHTDVDEVAAFLPDVLYQLRHYRGEGDKVTYAGFKHQLARQHPKCGMFMAPVKGAISNFLANPCHSTFFAPYQFFSFLTHLTLVDIDMSQELEDAFVENEELVRQHRTPDFMVSRLREIMQEWLRDFTVDESNFIPSHGPGSVAELSGDTTLNSKYDLVKPDQLLRVVFRMCARLDVDTYVPSNDAEVTSRTSQIVFVPKSMKTKRVISKEPATLMYFQQGIWQILRRHFRRHPELRRHIDLSDQNVQQERCLVAGSSELFATVDLSAASDSVSYDLVKRVFSGTPLYPFLVALRSQNVELPSGRVLRAAKFAPMGSALCFPVETLIFACICEVTARYVHHTTGNQNYQYWVYGDDIIVPDSHLADLLSNLRLCGFTPNEDKTFGQPYRFRESCGVDTYDGADVTPMKIGRRFTSRKIHIRSASVFQGLIDMANLAYVYEYRSLRRYVVDKLINETGWVPVFSNTGKHGLRTSGSTNYRVIHRWNDNHQVHEVRAAVPFSKQSKNGSLLWDSKRRRFVERATPGRDETFRYFEWLRLSFKRKAYLGNRPLEPEDIITPIAGSVGTYIAKRWIVEPE